MSSFDFKQFTVIMFKCRCLFVTKLPISLIIQVPKSVREHKMYHCTFPNPDMDISELMEQGK